MAGEASEGTHDEVPDVGRLLARRAAEYVDLWEAAVTRLTTSSYRSEHLLDDWFRLWGKAARDMTAGAALWWDAAARTASRRDRPGPRSG